MFKKPFICSMLLMMSSMLAVSAYAEDVSGDGELDVDANSEITIVRTLKGGVLNVNAPCKGELPKGAVVMFKGKKHTAECKRGRVAAGKNAVRHLDMTSGKHQ